MKEAAARISRARASHVRDVISLLVPLLASVALTYVLYGPSISYGFMFDDPLDLPRASGRSYLSILTSAGESSYYRPLILAVWKSLYDVFGRNDGPILHILVLASHAINGFLTYLIGSRLSGRIGGYMSALLFVSFPLSYQAVGNVNAFFHPLVTTFLLASVALYWRWREMGSARPLAVAIVCAVLAVFTHEYGVVVVALIVMAEAYWLLSQGLRRPSPVVSVFAGILVGFLAVWWLIPKWQHGWELDPASLGLNLLYFSQGLFYPIASRLADWQVSPFTPLIWEGVKGWSAMAMVAVFGGSTLAAMAAIHRLSRGMLSLGFALAWFAIGVLPAVLSLSFSYVIDGPRLFYLSSVGISLAWGGMLSAPFRWRTRALKVSSGLLSLGLVGLIVAQSALFIQERDALFVEGAKLVRNLAATAADPRRPGRTYVNFPSWFALKRPDYLLGHTGVIMVPYYISLGRVVYIQNGEQPEIEPLVYDVVAREWDHNYAAHGIKVGLDGLEGAFRKGGGVYATRFYSGSLEIEYVGGILQQEAEARDGRYVADFGGWGRLEAAETRLDRDVVDLTLRWSAQARPARDYTMFVHVYGADGKPVAQGDGYAIGEMFPPQRWRRGDVIEDRRRVSLPRVLPTGTYPVAVGLYDRQNGERAPASDADGKRYRDDVVIIGNIVK
ncbi:MAG: hypothetical protein HYY30_05955 [Chloroflexi bacterium]|nr:hypothetical protein [Chloroflexota bacterium]